MTTISCIIVDDEQPAIDFLSAYIQEVNFLTLAYTTTKSLHALEYLQQNPVDLVFLDIEMPLLKGPELLKLRAEQNKFIFTTAHSDSHYTLLGYEYGVIDYLTKPIPFDRFLLAVQRAQQLIQKPLATSLEASFLWISEGKGKKVKVDYADILYIEVMNKYSHIYTKDKSISALITIRELEGLLPQHQFFRVHKSYLVAFDQIDSVDGNRINLKPTSSSKPTVIPLGVTYREAFYQYMEEKRWKK